MLLDSKEKWRNIQQKYKQATKSAHRFVNKYVSKFGLFCFILQARTQAQNLVLV